MPQRVNDRTICSTTTTASAQISCEYVPPPNTFANVLISPTLVVPGVDTGWAWEMISVNPVRPNNVPSVVMNELMPTTVVKNPLKSPTATQASMASTSDGTRAMPPLLIS